MNVHEALDFYHLSPGLQGFFKVHPVSFERNMGLTCKEAFVCERNS